MGVAATNELLRVWSLQCWLCSVCYLCEAPVGFFFYSSWPPVEFLPATTNIKECFCVVFFFFFPRLALWKNIFVYLEVFPSHSPLLRGNISVLGCTVQCSSWLIYIYYLTVRYSVSQAPAHHALAKGASALNFVAFPATCDTYHRSEV